MDIYRSPKQFWQTCELRYYVNWRKEVFLGFSQIREHAGYTVTQQPE